MIGDLRTRLGIYEAVELSDAFGGSATSWPFWGACWGDIKTLSTQEFPANGRVEISLTYKITIRFRENFPERARIMHGDTLLRVITASDPDGRRERLHLMCEEERQ